MGVWLERKHERMKKIVEVNYQIFCESRRLMEDAAKKSVDGKLPQNIINLEATARWNYNESAERLREIESQIRYLGEVNR